MFDSDSSMRIYPILHSWVPLFITTLIFLTFVFFWLIFENPRLVLVERTSILLNSLSRTPDAPVHEANCQFALGEWCNTWYSDERRGKNLVKWKDPPSGNVSCLWDCNGVGVCDYLRGSCRCPAGWQGEACDARMDRPCSQSYRKFGSFHPNDAPYDYHSGLWMAGMCAGYCDLDYGSCYCPPETKYGRIPAPMGSPPGTPPQKVGRPMGLHCQPSTDEFGNSTGSKGDVTYKDLFGPDGWCNADKPNTTCSCGEARDGISGAFCDIPVEQFCVNQCSGRGECIQGFCMCNKGWFGQDCSYRQPQVNWSEGTQFDQRAWIRNVSRSPSSVYPPPDPQRSRPLIYVYELPPRFNQVILQYRGNSGNCIHRVFHPDNSTGSNHNSPYMIETGLHELLLQSSHRTLDPEEADFFYLPVYTACWQNPVHGYLDFPWFHGSSQSRRVHTAVNMMIEAHHWIQTTYPYWNRRGGKDHIVLAPHDEGSCWVPAVLRPAVILSHWGYTGYNNESFTSYFGDMFDIETKSQPYNPESHLAKLRDPVTNQNFRCFDPQKDLVLPSLWPEDKYMDSPLYKAGGVAANRTILGFHKGRILRNLTKYSRGSRVVLTDLCEKNNWWSLHRIYIGEKMPPGIEDLKYGEALARSIFCMVLMGEGFTTRFEDSLLHGCIPVIIMDNVTVTFESAIDVKKFSLRIDFKDMEKLPEILDAALPDVPELQQNIQQIWPRFRWDYERFWTGNGDDKAAMATLIQWLYSRLPH